tara:strand:- start:1015 stop:1392 length:378 start_codon:yes stop_codon:yes gene_type:complete
MELAKLLLKLLYLTAIYIVIYIVVKTQVPTMNTNFFVFVLGVSVLIMHFTFDRIYSFLMTNNLVLQKIGEDNKKTTNEKNDDDSVSVPENGSQTMIEKKVHVDNKASSEYMLDHTHKFIQNKIFD